MFPVCAKNSADQPSPDPAAKRTKTAYCQVRPRDRDQALCRTAPTLPPSRSSLRTLGFPPRCAPRPREVPTRARASAPLRAARSRVDCPRDPRRALPAIGETPLDALRRSFAMSTPSEFQNLSADAIEAARATGALQRAMFAMG